MTKWRVVCALVVGMVVASAQRTLTVAELTEFIKSTLRQKLDDRLVADYLLKHMKMKERVDDKKVEELQGLGAGPRTTAALRKLSQESASLPVAAPVVAPPPPPAPLPQPAAPKSRA